LKRLGIGVVALLTVMAAGCGQSDKKVAPPDTPLPQPSATAEATTSTIVVGSCPPVRTDTEDHHLQDAIQVVVTVAHQATPDLACLGTAQTNTDPGEQIPTLRVFAGDVPNGAVTVAKVEPIEGLGSTRVKITWQVDSGPAITSCVTLDGPAVTAKFEPGLAGCSGGFSPP
jgi:hypothetical protein